MIKVGITGGIGCGKTVVSEIFRLHGYPLYNADKEAKALNNSSSYIRDQLTQRFGDDLYVNNQLNKRKLASLIFNDRQNLETVNSIIHPELARHFIEWSRQHEEHHQMVILDAALLIEAGFNNFVDKTIVVQAPKEIRLARVMQRDGATREEVEARINSQMPEEEKLQYADFIIHNDDAHSLIRQVSTFIHLVEAKLN